MSLKVKGLILKETITKESDKVLTILTKDGLMSLYAKAAKNIKSKKFTATNLLCYSEFVLQEGNDLYKVIKRKRIFGFDRYFLRIKRRY